MPLGKLNKVSKAKDGEIASCGCAWESIPGKLKPRIRNIEDISPLVSYSDSCPQGMEGRFLFPTSQRTYCATNCQKRSVCGIWASTDSKMSRIPCESFKCWHPLCSKTSQLCE